MAEETNSGAPSERLKLVRDPIGFENAHDLNIISAALRGSRRSG